MLFIESKRHFFRTFLYGFIHHTCFRVQNEREKNQMRIERSADILFSLCDDFWLKEFDKGFFYFWNQLPNPIFSESTISHGYF